MIKLKIEGMTCNHCVKSVSEALAKVPGVNKVVDVSLDQKEAVVNGHAQAATLVSALADLGYEAQVA
jgi:copper chaperone